MEHEDFGFLIATPQRLEFILDGLNDEDSRWHPVGEGWTVLGHHVGWSIVQHVCHLRDLEIEGYGPRLVRLGCEDHPFMPDFVGDRLAAERDYDAQDVHAALASFRAARLLSVESARIALLKPSARGTLESVGEIDVPQLLGFMREHDEGHLEALERLMAEQRRQAS